MTEKVAIVTGASSGIGAAIASTFAAAGFKVIAAGRDKDRTKLVSDSHLNISEWIGDITTSAACNALVANTLDLYDRLDVLVNCAGIWFSASAEETTDAQWRKTIAINLDAVFYLSRAAIPHLRKTRGVILNISSEWGLVGGEEVAAYCASKGGVVLLTKAMAKDHAREGIRINSICPADVDTPMLIDDAKQRGVDESTALEQANSLSPTGRVTAASEVAELALYLSSNSAAQITGAAIPIDGSNTA